MRTGRIREKMVPMRHAELLPAFSLALALAVARLRFVVLTAWRCRSCGEPHLHCGCKPAWIRLLL
jgi:hypothetical protein